MLSLIVVMTMVVLAGTFLEFSSAVTRRQAESTDLKRAFYLAEAGLAESFAGVMIGKTGNVGTQAKPARFGAGLLWVEAEDLGAGQRSLCSTGMAGTASATLDIVINEGSQSVAALGVHSTGDLDLPSGTFIDAYDSREGPYVDPALATLVEDTFTAGESLTGRIIEYEDVGTPDAARVSTNGNVTITELLLDTTAVVGDLRPGPTGTITRSGGVEVDGTTEPLATAVVLPQVEAPIYATVDPGYMHNSATPLVVPTTSSAREYLYIMAGSTVTLTGPTSLVLGELQVQTGGELIIDTTGGDVDIYVEDILNFQTGSFLTFTGTDTTATTLQYSGTGVAKLLATSDFYGAIYCPNGELRVGADVEVFGAVIANQLAFPSAATVHFDLALADAAIDSALPGFVTWWIVELAAAKSPNGDPFDALGVDRNLLDGPADSHADQNLKLSYYDTSGTPQTYDGPESTFDWGTVSQVTSIQRDDLTVGGVEGLLGVGGIGYGTSNIALVQ